ncbi:hypothetical protein SOVF_089390 [Spinacia oleracea]|nr:hypothetical protein SOVF_089390 [Spinacia oleracea]
MRTSYRRLTRRQCHFHAVKSPPWLMNPGSHGGRRSPWSGVTFPCGRCPSIRCRVRGISRRFWEQHRRTTP